MGKKLTTAEFISKARLVHGDKYDYSKVVYVNNLTKVCIVCHQHGEFLIPPSSLLNGRGCSLCGRIRTNESKRYTKHSFIEKARKVHGEKFDYSEVEYINYFTPVKIICPVHGAFFQQPTLHLAGRGCTRCNMSGVKRTTLYGIAIVDIPSANSPATRLCYTLWKDMLARCYNPNVLKRYPTYIGCTVCKEWLLFSNFKKWFDENYIEGYDLDKDIIIKGNKVYSPETCCFVPHKLNCTINKCQRSRGELPIGVSFDKSRQKYIAGLRVGMVKKCLGRFDTSIAAFKAYKAAKEQFVKELAERYFQEGKITEKIYDALMKYEVEITD